jgi:hypothetical protein
MAKLLDGTRIYGSANIDNNLIVNTMNIVPTIVAAFDKANQQTNLAFTTIVANGTSLIADSNSDTLTIRTTGNVSITADASGDNMTFDLTTTGVTAATYGGATIVPVLTVDARGRLTSVTNTTINTFSFGVVVANGTSLVADTGNDTLTIRTTGNVAITADATGDNMTFDLTTTGVTAATYGSSTIVPVFVVDARGRLTSVTNTTIDTSIATAAFAQANTANTTAIAAFGQANTANTTAVAAFAKANLAAPIASPTFTGVVTVPSSLIVLKGGDPAEGGQINFEKSSGSNISGNLNIDLFYDKVRIFEETGTNRGFFLDITKGNTGVGGEILHTNNWFNYISTSGSAAFDKANSANVIASAAFDKANSANVIASAAFDFANTRLSSNGGTIFGSLTVSGNLTISGNTTFINVSTYSVTDPLIYLAANNYTSDLVDIGFVANYVNATGSNVHTGLMRDSGTKEYYLFQGYDQEPQNNHIDPSGNNFTISFLNANIRSSNIILNNINLTNWLISSYDKANQQTNLAFSTIVANGTSLVADSNADTLTIRTTGNVAITADAAGDNLTFDLTTTGVTAATYGGATIVPVLNVDSRGRLTSVTNTTIDTTIASAAFDRANIANNLPVQKSGTIIGTRNALNFIEGSNVTITVADDSVGNRINVTIAASGGGGGSGTGNAQAAFDQANAAYNQANAALTNSIVFISDSAPTGIANGFLWWQSNTGSLYVRYGDGDSSQWVATQQQGLGGTAVFSQPAANAIAQSPSQLLISANGMAYTSSTFATSGDAIVRQYMLIGTTTNATPTRLLHSSGAGLIPVGSNTTMQYTIDISARRTDVTGEGAGWTLKGVLDSFSGTVADVGNLYEIVIARDDANYVVDAFANNTTKSLDVFVTGVNAKTIRWVAYVQTVEVSQ